MTSPHQYRIMKFIRNNLALALISVSIIIVERIVKFYITQNLRNGESVSVFGNFFMITRSENLGAGFGIMQGQNWLFIIAALAVLSLIVYFYNQIIYDTLLVISSSFILAGTVGNMMDRIFFGHVIDFIDIAFWPTFNFSDMSLVIGAVLLIIYMHFWHNEEPREIKYMPY